MGTARIDVERAFPLLQDRCVSADPTIVQTGQARLPPAGSIVAVLSMFFCPPIRLPVNLDDVWFSEVSPRPHDTGMVTMATQYQNEFELHARAILGLPVSTTLREPGASAVIYGQMDEKGIAFEGIEKALAIPQTDIRLFGKPEAFKKRRMGVALAYGNDVDDARKRAKEAAGVVKTVVE